MKKNKGESKKGVEVRMMRGNGGKFAEGRQPIKT